MGCGRALAKCNIAVAGQYREYGYPKVSGWITNMGGSPSTTVGQATTHVVATGKAWKRKDAAVKQAMKTNENRDSGEAKIKIVSFDWLEDSVNNKTKKREGPYLWQKLDAAVAKQDAAKAREAKAKKSKGHVSMVTEAFQEGTEQWVDPKEARAVERQIEEDRRVKAAIEEEEKRDAKRKKKAEEFAVGAKKAKNEIFSENHHIYADETKFRYEVTLTKVDTRHNRNERCTLTIYESNAEPHTYAVNVNLGGTNQKTKNEIIVPIGSPFPPAFRAFKKAFKERTGGSWDNRIHDHIERQKKEKRERGQATGSEDQGSRKGTAVSTQEEKDKQKEKEDKEWEKLPFEYHPPRFGGKGKLPKDMELPAELVRGKTSDIDRWLMSGALPSDGDQNAPIQIEEDEAEDENATNGETDGNQAMLAVDNANTDMAATAMDAPSSVFDQGLNEWVGETFDEHYPFDHHQENLDYLAQANQQAHDDILFADTLGTEMADEIQPMIDGEFIGEQHNISFDPTGTNIAEPPISFDRPSTVQESFEPGTQDITETQMAERAQGEFDEFINHNAMHENVADPIDSPQVPNFDFGNSILGKRKTPEPDVEAEQFSPKKAKYNDEDEAFALAADEDYLGEDAAYQFAT